MSVNETAKKREGQANDHIVIQFPINRQCPEVKQVDPPIVEMELKALKQMPILRSK